MSTEYNGRKPEYKEYAEPNLTRTLSVPTEGAFEAAFYVDDSRDEKPPKRYAPHIHDTLEIYFLLDGESSFSVENKIYKLGAGDAVISRPNEHDRTHDKRAVFVARRPKPVDDISESERKKHTRNKRNNFLVRRINAALRRIDRLHIPVGFGRISNVVEPEPD